MSPALGFRGGQVGEDRGQVAVGEPAGGRGGAECPVDDVGPVQTGEGDGLGHLRPHPGRPRGRGLDEPEPRSVTQRAELRLGSRTRTGRAGSTVTTGRSPGCRRAVPPAASGHPHGRHWAGTRGRRQSGRRAWVDGPYRHTTAAHGEISTQEVATRCGPAPQAYRWVRAPSDRCTNWGEIRVDSRT